MKTKTISSVSGYASPLIDTQLISSDVLCASTEYNNLPINQGYIHDYSGDVSFE